MPKPIRSGPDPRRFCPRCAQARKTAGPLCDDCGEALVDQGYCATCEDFWPLREGTPCPKHDLPLGPRPDDAPAWPDGRPIRWVTVRSYPHPIAANAARLRLEAEGIPTFLSGERMAGNVLYQVATGGVKLQVPAELLADARVLLAQSWAAPVAEDDIEDWDDGVVASEPVSAPGLDTEGARPNWRREFGLAVWVFALALLVAALLVFWPDGT